MGEQALTINEAAKRLMINPNVLRMWVREGRIPAIKLGRVWRITEETITKILRGELKIE
jgi:excisionase family DNA binding protein